MPSPFPGMDPFVEDRARWPGFHQSFAANMKAALNAVLPKRYVADSGERVYMVNEPRQVYPDVAVVENPVVREPAAIAEEEIDISCQTDAPLVIKVEPVEVHEYYVEVMTLPKEERVVAVIELLSPSNKTAGSEGRRLYLSKQREVFEGQAHLIEIDFLRTGHYTVAAPPELLVAKAKWDYLVSLSRGTDRFTFEVWPITLRQRLPRIAIPLLKGDPDVPLDLQALFDRSYEGGAYDRRLDYRRDPPVPLRPEDAAWADALLKERGLRPRTA